MTVQEFNQTDNKHDPPSTKQMPWTISCTEEYSNYQNKTENKNNETITGGKKEKYPKDGGIALEECDFETAISETGYGKYNLFLLVGSIPGFFACLNVTGSTSLIIPSAECDLNLTKVEMGVMNSISYIGMITCAFFWGFLSDLFGRKKILVIAFLLDTCINITAGLSQTFKFFIAAKLFSGFIAAGPYALLMSYLAECHANKYRASVLLWTGVISAFGNIGLPALAWFIIPQPIHIYLFSGSISLPSWRIFLLVCTIPSLSAAIILSFLGESPKFLMSRGRNDAAMEVFKTMYSLNTGKPKNTFPVKSLMKEVSENDGPRKKFAWLHKGIKQFKPLFQKPYLSNIMLIFAIQFFTFCGLNTIRLWMPQLFSTMIDIENNPASDETPTTICELLHPVQVNTTKMTDFTKCTNHFVDPKVFINTIISGVISGVSYLGSGCAIALLGKKLLLIILYIGSCLCSISMYWAAGSNVMMFVTSMFVTMTSICSTTIISVIVDLVSTSQRSMAVCLVMMMGRTGSIIGNVSFPLLLDWSCKVLFFLLAGITFGSGALTLWLPKTKGNLK